LQMKNMINRKSAKQIEQFKGKGGVAKAKL
jgi:hypothetical protein